jgi:hypothetical protein
MEQGDRVASFGQRKLPSSISVDVRCFLSRAIQRQHCGRNLEMASGGFGWRPAPTDHMVSAP